MASIQIFPHNEVEYGIHVRREGQEESVYFLYIDESPKKFIRPDFSEEYENLSDLLVQEDIYGEKNNEIVIAITDRLNLAGITTDGM